MKPKSLTYVILCLILLLGISLFINYKQYRDKKEQSVSIKEVTVVEYAEKKDVLPSPKTEKTVGTIKVAIPRNNPKLSDCIVNASNAIHESNDSLELEITQKVYKDSTYTAYVSGHMPSLDSIFIRQKEITRTITETRPVEKKEFRRWNVGLIGGYGYGFSSKKFEPFVGIGITYNMFK